MAIVIILLAIVIIAITAIAVLQVYNHPPYGRAISIGINSESPDQGIPIGAGGKWGVGHYFYSADSDHAVHLKSVKINVGGTFNNETIRVAVAAFGQHFLGNSQLRQVFKTYTATDSYWLTSDEINELNGWNSSIIGLYIIASTTQGSTAVTVNATVLTE